MTAQILCCRYYNDIRSKIYRPKNTDAYGIIYDQWNTCFVGYLGEHFKIRNIQFWVTYCFQVDCLCFGC